MAASESSSPTIILIKTLAWSLLVMVPWPLLGWLIGLPYFEQASEGFFVLGGLTVLVLLPLALFVELSEAWLCFLIVVGWLICYALPPLVVSRFKPRWQILLVVLVVQSMVSFLQAALGLLMVLGKHV